MGPKTADITDDEPTIEEEAIGFEPTSTDQIDDDFRVSATLESNAGAIAFDERGQSRWKWSSESTAVEPNEGTFDQLKSLTNEMLALEEPAADAAPEQGPKGPGYNPYDTAKPGGPRKR